MTLLDAVHAALCEDGVPHALIGAMALAAHGVSRASLDVDLLATDARLLDPAVWKRHGIAADCRPGGTFDPLAGVVRLTQAGALPVDIVLFGSHGWQHQVLERASGPRVPVATPEDLVRLKLFAGGPRDRADIHALLDLSPALATTDVSMLPDGAQQLWARLLAER